MASRIFLSWSGSNSKAVATLLHSWLRDVLPMTVEPWMSAEDIDAGSRWGEELSRQLTNTQIGILCLTKSNVTAPWLLFEAGALAKTVEKTWVVPYLIGFESAGIPPGPLTQFQAKTATETGTWDVIKAIRSTTPEDTRSEAEAERTFKKFWPDLQDLIANLPPEVSDLAPKRSTEDKIDEVIEITRDLSRRIFKLGVLSDFADHLVQPASSLNINQHVAHGTYGFGVVTGIKDFEDGTNVIVKFTDKSIRFPLSAKLLALPPDSSMKQISNAPSAGIRTPAPPRTTRNSPPPDDGLDEADPFADE